MSNHLSLRTGQNQGRVVALADAGAVLIGLEEIDVLPAAEPEEAASNASGAFVLSTNLANLPAERLGELIGQTLGHFKIGWLLGRGHYGAVFRAHDRNREQAVALKVLPPVFPADTEEMDFFVAAVKPVLSLQHSNLVQLRGVGKTGSYVWLAQELVAGESLAEWNGHTDTSARFKGRPANRHTAKQTGTLEWRPALRVALQITGALDFARRHHLLHRNITPANILLDAKDGTARLNDLGFWGALVGSTLQHQRLERKFLAELPYLSPEHIDPVAAIDELSDQYSLGAVVYALLKGRPPFEGQSPEETMTQIRSALPASPKEFQSTIPDEFQAVVLRMLAKCPGERFPTFGILLAELKKIAAEHGED